MTSTGIRGLSLHTKRSIYVPLMTRLIAINDVTPIRRLSQSFAVLRVRHEAPAKLRRDRRVFPGDDESADEIERCECAVKVQSAEFSECVCVCSCENTSSSQRRSYAPDSSC